MRRCCAITALVAATGDHLHADGAGSRVFDAGLRKARGGAFRGVRRFCAHELATRIDDCSAKAVISASCGLEPGRVCPTSRCWITRSTWRASSRTTASCCSATNCMRRCATSMATSISARRSRRRSFWAMTCPARRFWPPIPFMFSIRRAQQASPKAWCATMAGTWWRCPGRCATSTASSRARCSGRPPISAGWWVTPISSMAPCSPATPPFCSKASLWERPMPAPSGGSCRSMTSRCCSLRPPRSVRSSAMIPMVSSSANMISPACVPSSWPVNGLIPKPSNGPKSSSMCRSSTTGGRRKRVGRWRQTLRGLALADQVRLACRRNAGLPDRGGR